MPDNTDITPELRRVLDRLVSAGWLEQVTDRPNDPIKGLHWIKDPTPGKPEGNAKLIAFNLLYAELCRYGPMTLDDLLVIEAFGKTVRDSNSN